VDSHRPADLSDALERDGALVVADILGAPQVKRLRAEFEGIEDARPGRRQFALSPCAAVLIGPDGALGSLAASLAGASANPVRLIYFDKTPQSNWAVPWHQDRTIAVRERQDVSGFGPWSLKDGVLHVEPPVSLMDTMLTLRVFVDDCSADNGPLEVAFGSHRCGRLASADIAGVAGRAGVFIATGRAGDVLAMKTLAVHRSARATRAAHRRVLHVDYATVDLPAPLAWALCSDPAAA
jgi:hypothetical protein